MSEKKITTEKVSIDAQGKQVKIGDTVYSFAKNYRSLVEAKVIDITPKTLLVEYINNWNYSAGRKEQYRVGSDQIMLKATEDISKETANEWISVKDRLPEERTEVLVYRGSYIGDMMNVYTYLGNGEWEDSYGYWSRTEDEGITYWMSLPEKLKEE